VVAGLAGLILVAAVRGSRSSGIPLELSLLLWLSTGLWLGIAETILLAGMRRVARATQAGIGERFAPWIWPTLAALLASPAILALGLRLFSSPGSTRLRFAPAGPALVAIVGTVAVFFSVRLFIIARCTARNVRRSIAGVVLVIASVILVGPACAIPPGYGYLCDAVMLTSFVLVQSALHLDVERLASRRILCRHGGSAICRVLLARQWLSSCGRCPPARARSYRTIKIRPATWPACGGTQSTSTGTASLPYSAVVIATISIAA
jgi:hypothetical protein